MSTNYVKAFIQNPIGSDMNHQYDEKTFAFLGTDKINGKYPYPYGFIPKTRAEDGDCLDCFVITEKKLETGSIHDLLILGLMEVWENDEEDHKLLLSFPQEKLDFDVEKQAKLKVFEENIFSFVEGRTMKVGFFRNEKIAYEHYIGCVT